MSEKILAYDALELKTALGIDDRYPVYFSVLDNDVDLPTPNVYERDQIESDTTKIQPIPVICGIRSTETGVEILSHIRENSGDTRLIDKCSIYFGGHVDEQDNGEDGQYLKNCLLRELKEELNVVDPIVREKLSSMVDNQACAVLYSNVDDVSKVHVGFVYFISLDSVTVKETDESGHLTWMTIEDLIKSHSSGKISLDTWSEIIVKNLQLFI